jgi:hypothetical protein
MTKRRTQSSSLAIGTTAIFLTLAGLVSFLADDGGVLDRAWSLRGTLVPSAQAEER